MVYGGRGEVGSRASRAQGRERGCARETKKIKGRITRIHQRDREIERGGEG